MEKLKAEVEELQREKEELDCTQKELDEEMETLSMHTSALTQMDMLKKRKVKGNFSTSFTCHFPSFPFSPLILPLSVLQAEMEERICKIKSSHSEDLLSLLGLFPNKKELEEWISSKSQEISSTGNKLAKLKLVTLSTNVTKDAPFLTFTTVTLCFSSQSGPGLK